MRTNTKSLIILTALSFTVVLGSYTLQRGKGLPGPKEEKITVPSDFVVEHLYSPSENEKGSWVSMTFDNKGRLIASDQYGALYRLELPAIGADSSGLKIEKLKFPNNSNLENDPKKPKVEIGYAQGLLYAFNSLYVMINHQPNEEFEKGSGLYRLQDTDNDDQFDTITKLISLEGEGEHGPHSVVLGPDGKSIYVVAGNHTDVPKMDHYRLPNNWGEDNLFPRITDPQGHATDRLAPGSWIAKTDSLGQHWELIGAGLRNTFDITFDNAGELFAYDSDMEWDFGMPWYRPTRLLHVTSGSEFGWRTGNGKWAPEYPDNLPAMLNVGQGSPTNLIFAGNADFPERYKKGLLAFDWSFGIIYFVDIQPEGATYKAKAEEFLSGTPLPLTDGVIGPDGALYFMTGGRKLDSDLYRVSYKNRDKSGQPRQVADAPSLNSEHATRRKLEEYHRPSKDPKAINFIWKYLKDEDRHIRYAARIALEHQPIDSWINKVWKEKNSTAIVQSMIAVTRNGDSSLRGQVFKKLAAIKSDKLSRDEKIDLLRTYELALIRLGTPTPAEKASLIALLDPAYPSSDNILDRQLSKLLVSLDAPKVVEKTLAMLYEVKDDARYQETVTSSSDLILRNPQYGMDIARMLAKTPPAQQIYFATVLSRANTGWTYELREKYFRWYHQAFEYKGGNSFIGFLDRARKMALETVPKDEFAFMNTISGDSLLNQSGTSLALTVEGPKGPGRDWKMEDALPVVEKDTGTRNFKQGMTLFASVQCGTCHSIQGEGGSIGPDLTQLGTRFSKRDMLEALIKPSEVISDQYISKIYSLNDGTSVLGRLANEDEKSYFVIQNPYAPKMLKEVSKKDVREIKPAKVSIMPPGTINSLNEEELRDLIAYLMAGGNENHVLYK